MMRAVVVILVLVCGLVSGLATALVFEGRMTHLRGFAGAALPGWTEVIAPSAGLLDGQTGAFPGIAAVTASWRFERFTRDGMVPVPVWRLRLEGAGLLLEGEMRVARADPAGAGLGLSALRGRIDTAGLPIRAEAPGLDGRFDVIRGAAVIDPRSGRFTRFAAEGLAIVPDDGTGAALEGRFSALLADDGTWFIGADLGGPDDQGRLELVFDLGAGALDLVHSPAEGAVRRETLPLATGAEGG